MSVLSKPVRPQPVVRQTTMLAPLGMSIALVAVVSALYLALSGGWGFPLDDAWIHQDFARNLGQHGQFTYALNQPGAGSTSPLWVLLLSLGYILPLPPLAWAYLVGALLFICLLLALQALARTVFPDRPRLAYLVLVAAGLEWHLGWASLSGMETVLFTLLTVVLFLLYQRHASPLLLGALGALLTSTRPEGIVLVLICITLRYLWPGPASLAQRVTGMAQLVGAFTLLIIPYVLLNYSTGGHPLPSTFYAKRGFYAPAFLLLRALTYWGGIFYPFLLSSPIVVLLVPGFLYKLVSFGPAIRRAVQGDSDALTPWIPLLWGIALIGAYTIILPVLYQNGRYVIPLLPFVILYGMSGSLELLARMAGFRTLKRAVPLLGTLLLLVSLGRGAIIYAQNVRYINTYQVGVARWLAANTPPGTVVATHDIGAIGYFGNRQVIDMAGLVQPQLIALLTDQPALLAYLQAHHTSYVAMLSGWFDGLDKQQTIETYYQRHGQIVFRVHDTHLGILAGPDFVVYKTSV